MQTTHYIFVDFENVRRVKPDLIAEKPVQLIMVLGKQDKSLPLDMVKQFLALSGQVRFVETQKQGSNALDFVLACEVGVQAEADPAGAFHIVSRDKGFDALVEHLRSKGRTVARHDSFAAVPCLKSAGAAAPSPAPVRPARRLGTDVNARAGRRGTQEGRVAAAPKNASAATSKSRAAEIAQWLNKYPNNRPRRKPSLLKLIRAQLPGPLPDPEVLAIVKGLEAQKVIAISDSAVVSYPA